MAEIKTQYGYYENYWTIDGVALPNLLDLKSKGIDDDFVQSDIKSFLGLCPAWNLDLEWRGDVRFVWKLIEMDYVPLPPAFVPVRPRFHMHCHCGRGRKNGRFRLLEQDRLRIKR